MVRVAMQLMAGHMLKAATSTRKFLKASHWLLKVRKETIARGGGGGGGVPYVQACVRASTSRACAPRFQRLPTRHTVSFSPFVL